MPSTRASRRPVRTVPTRAPARRHESRLRQLDVPQAGRTTGEGPPSRPAAERLGLHGDVDLSCATLSAAWPLPSLTFQTS
jgi:hypothetical protein